MASSQYVLPVDLRKILLFLQVSVVDLDRKSSAHRELVVGVRWRALPLPTPIPATSWADVNRYGLSNQRASTASSVQGGLAS